MSSAGIHQANSRTEMFSAPFSCRNNAGMDPLSPHPDPRPRPPDKPLPQDCCDSGCQMCVNDVYAAELEGYRLALALWLKRHPEADPVVEHASSGRHPAD